MYKKLICYLIPTWILHILFWFWGIEREFRWIKDAVNWVYRMNDTHFSKAFFGSKSQAVGMECTSCGKSIGVVKKMPYLCMGRHLWGDQGMGHWWPLGSHPRSGLDALRHQLDFGGGCQQGGKLAYWVLAAGFFWVGSLFTKMSKWKNYMDQYVSF